MIDTNTISKHSQVEHKANAISIRDIIFKYITYLPLFVLSLVLCTSVGYIYIRYATKLYRVNGSMLIGGLDAVPKSQMGELLTTALYGTRTVNMQNEIEAIRSRELLYNLVHKNKLNHYYYNLGQIKNMDITGFSPVLFYPLSISDSGITHQVDIIHVNPQTLKVKFGTYAPKEFRWNDTVNVDGMRGYFSLLYPIQTASDEPYRFVWSPLMQAASEIQAKLSIAGANEKTSIMSLSMVSDNPVRSATILNLLMDEVKVRDLELKKLTSVKTVAFINERLDTIAVELKNLDEQILNTRTSSRFVDLEQELGYYNGRLNNAESEVELYDRKLKAVQDLATYLNDDKTQYEVVPIDYLLEDGVIDPTIKRYNDLIIAYKREGHSNANGSVLIQNLQKQIQDIRSIIFESLLVFKRAVANQKQLSSQKFDNFLQPLSSIPKRQRNELSLRRQKQIKDQLYLYLLQKKEETSITSLSAQSNYQILEKAAPNNNPIEPKSKSILTFCLLVGAIVPVGLIFILELLNDKVTVRNDIIQKTSIPIVGEIIHHDRSSLLVVSGVRSVVAEQFRILRANLQFLLTMEECKTIMITSSVGGEGKSFTSRNLAAVLSLMDKKVALLQFDLRKRQEEIFEITSNYSGKGIVNFLIGQHASINEIVHTVEGYPNLHIIGTGPIPPNPSELLLSPKMEEFFNQLKGQYDYVVMDTAPASMVSDAFILSKFADTTLFLFRQRFTYKRQLEFINEIYEEGKLKNLAIVVNDVRISGRYGYYGYSQSYAYRYGYAYPYFGAKKIQDSYFEPEKKQSIWKRIFG